MAVGGDGAPNASSMARLVAWLKARTKAQRTGALLVAICVPLGVVLFLGEIDTERELDDLRESGERCPVRVEVTGEQVTRATIEVEARDVDFRDQNAALPFKRCFVTLGAVEVVAEHEQARGSIRCLVVNDQQITAMERAQAPSSRVRCDG